MVFIYAAALALISIFFTSANAIIANNTDKRQLSALERQLIGKWLLRGETKIPTLLYWLELTENHKAIVHIHDNCRFANAPRTTNWLLTDRKEITFSNTKLLKPFGNCLTITSNNYGDVVLVTCGAKASAQRHNYSYHYCFVRDH